MAWCSVKAQGQQDRSFSGAIVMVVVIIMMMMMIYNIWKHFQETIQ
jgi:hypothetical protein